MAVELYYDDRGMNKLISHMPGVVGAVAAKATEGGAVAAGILAAHFYQGHSTIEVNHGGVDSFVRLDDTRGQRAAAAIEYGRKSGPGAPTQAVRALRAAFGL